MAPVLPFLMVGAMAAGAATSIYSAMNPPEAPKPPSATDQAKSDRAALDAAYAQSEVLRKRKGSSSTILTGPLGVTEPAQTVHAQLGG